MRSNTYLQANIASLKRGLRNLYHAMAPSIALETEGRLPDTTTLTAWRARLERWNIELANYLSHNTKEQ